MSGSNAWKLLIHRISPMSDTRYNLLKLRPNIPCHLL